MRKVAGAAALLCIALLLACSAQALAAARDALTLWWSAVLPSLFPFFVLVGLLQDYGMLDCLCQITCLLFPRSARLKAGIPAFLLGALSGFPTGARVCAMLGQSGLSVYCNLCSPIFLLGVISVNLARDIRLFLPICIGHYGSALLLFLFSLCFPARDARAAFTNEDATPAAGVIGRIGEGMTAMLRIGGCIVFFSVLSALLCEIGLFPLLGRILAFTGAAPDVTVALLTGALEMTTGCAAIATLSLPSPVQAALYAATVSFGGICILAQTLMVARIERPLRYLAGKALQSALAGMLAFLLAPLFLQSDIPTMQFPDADTVMSNTVSGLSLLIASLVGVFGAYILSACLQLLQNKRTGDRSPDHSR